MVTNPQIILVDGPAGAGKTTFALDLQRKLNCEVIHLDDHYDGWEKALDTGLTELLLQLTRNFKAGFASELPIYNWHQASFDGVRTIQPAAHLIIEGVGSGQSSIRALATELYWIDIDPELGLKRVLERDGAEYEIEIRKWQNREAKHFAIERTRDFADFIISTT
jgi:uridine kinase